jgi:hypothetical protein
MIFGKRSNRHCHTAADLMRSHVSLNGKPKASANPKRSRLRLAVKRGQFKAAAPYVTVVIVAMAAVPVLAGKESQPECDYLEIVRDYADAMIAQGRDVYGKEHSPLFAEALDRTTRRMLEGDVLQKVASISRDQWGVRPHDRMISGGNPQHCLARTRPLRGRHERRHIDDGTAAAVAGARASGTGAQARVHGPVIRGSPTALGGKQSLECGDSSPLWISLSRAGCINVNSLAPRRRRGHGEF